MPGDDAERDGIQAILESKASSTGDEREKHPHLHLFRLLSPKQTIQLTKNTQFPEPRGLVALGMMRPTHCTRHFCTSKPIGITPIIGAQ